MSIEHQLRALARSDKAHNVADCVGTDVTEPKLSHFSQQTVGDPAFLSSGARDLDQVPEKGM
jgi:hypothetical protein